MIIRPIKKFHHEEWTALSTHTVRKVLADFAAWDWWRYRYCKALCDVKSSQIEENCWKLSHICTVDSRQQSCEKISKNMLTIYFRNFSTYFLVSFYSTKCPFTQHKLWQAITTLKVKTFCFFALKHIPVTNMSTISSI